MDELQISGKRFISSRRIAKDNGYHTDYIGQLIRGGKIKGQKVGRTWYVDAASFDAYLGQEGATQPAVETMQQSVDVPAQAVPVEPPAPTIEEKPAEPIESIAQPEPVVHVTVQEVEPVAHIEIKKETEAKVEEPAHVVEEVTMAEVVPAPVAPKPIVPTSKIELVGGLRYVRDDEPLLPEIAPRVAPSRHVEIKKESAIVADEPMVVVAPTVRSKPSRWMVGVLAIVGVVIFGFSAYVSSTLIQTINIDAGNPASVSYSMHW